MFLFFLFILVIQARILSACLTSGICGGIPGGSSSCLPPLPPAPAPSPICQPSCGPGYQCGQYGCARKKARAQSSGGIFIPHSRTSIVGPNQLFMRCCEDRGLPDVCLEKCNFRTFNKEVLLSMYFKRDACPIEASTEIHYCAAQGQDHRACCIRNGVATTIAGEKCLVFCDQRPGNVTKLDLSYASCYDRFDNMKSCFWHNMVARLDTTRF